MGMQTNGCMATCLESIDWKCAQVNHADYVIADVIVESIFVNLIRFNGAKKSDENLGGFSVTSTLKRNTRSKNEKSYVC